MAISVLIIYQAMWCSLFIILSPEYNLFYKNTISYI